ncbi:MAG: hypothetical protein Q8T09_02670 [Candidatus Melainabacteria bacterium]|nr:hypothetical protein [Candidatus Melainabacteria bacterium]
MISVSLVVRPIFILGFALVLVISLVLPQAFAQSSVSTSAPPNVQPLAASSEVSLVAPRFEPTALGVFANHLAFDGWTGAPLYLWQSATGALLPQLPESDGLKASILQEYGLQSFTRKSLHRGQRYIHVDVYEFANNDGAFAAYSFLRRGATTVVLRGDATSEDDDSISFVQGKTFISIYGTSSDDEESKDVIRRVATKIAKAIVETGAPPYILSTMPQLEFLHGSEKIVMGPVSARRFCPAPYLNSLDFKQSRLACVADYQMREPVKERVKLLLVDYGGNAKAAAASYQSYISALCQSRDENPDLRLAQDTNQFRNGATFTEIQLHGSRIFMVTGARKRYSAELLLRQIR